MFRVVCGTLETIEKIRTMLTNEPHRMLAAYCVFFKSAEFAQPIAFACPAALGVLLLPYPQRSLAVLTTHCADL